MPLGVERKQTMPEELDHKVIARGPQPVLRTEMMLHQPQGCTSRVTDPTHRRRCEPALSKLFQSHVTNSGTRGQIARIVRM